LLHQGRIFPIVVVHGGTVGEHGIELQLWRISADGGNFFRRPAAADPGRDPGAELAQRIRRQSISAYQGHEAVLMPVAQ
jgi:hypothetical protein